MSELFVCNFPVFVTFDCALFVDRRTVGVTAAGYAVDVKNKQKKTFSLRLFFLIFFFNHPVTFIHLSSGHQGGRLQASLGILQELTASEKLTRLMALMKLTT